MMHGPIHIKKQQLCLLVAKPGPYIRETPIKEEVQTKFLRPLLRLTIKDHHTKSNTRNKLKIGNVVQDIKA